MAKIEFTPGIEGMQGALSKSGIISRQKVYRDARGRVIGYGKQEGYMISHPRNFKTHPMTGDELAHHNLWRAVCLETKNELADPVTRGQWEARFQAQLPSTKGTKADAAAPIDPATGAQKRYTQLYTFTRAMLYYSMKENQ